MKTMLLAVAAILVLAGCEGHASAVQGDEKGFDEGKCRIWATFADYPYRAANPTAQVKFSRAMESAFRLAARESVGAAATALFAGLREGWNGFAFAAAEKGGLDDWLVARAVFREEAAVPELCAGLRTGWDSLEDSEVKYDWSWLSEAMKPGDVIAWGVTGRDWGEVTVPGWSGDAMSGALATLPGDTCGYVTRQIAEAYEVLSEALKSGTRAKYYVEAAKGAGEWAKSWRWRNRNDC